MKDNFPVSLSCEVLGVSVSGYFEHERRRQQRQPQHYEEERKQNGRQHTGSDAIPERLGSGVRVFPQADQGFEVAAPTPALTQREATRDDQRDDADGKLDLQPGVDIGHDVLPLPCKALSPAPCALWRTQVPRSTPRSICSIRSRS